MFVRGVREDDSAGFLVVRARNGAWNLRSRHGLLSFYSTAAGEEAALYRTTVCCLAHYSNQTFSRYCDHCITN